MMSLGRYYQDEKNDRKAFYWYQNAAGKGTHKLASQIFHLKSRWLLGTESNGAHVCSRKDVWHTYSWFPILTLLMAQWVDMKAEKNTHWARAWSTYLRLILGYRFIGPYQESQKSMKEMRGFYKLTPPRLPIEPLGGLKNLIPENRCNFW